VSSALFTRQPRFFVLSRRILAAYQHFSKQSPAMFQWTTSGIVWWKA